METKNRPTWENLSEDQRNAWIQSVINFYPPNSSTPQEIIELAKDEYTDAESLLPVREVFEAD